MADDTPLSWALERLDEAAPTLHGLIYEGDRPSYQLGEDLDIDLRCDLIRVIHDIDFAAKKVRVAERQLLAGSSA